MFGCFGHRQTIEKTLSGNMPNGHRHMGAGLERTLQFTPRLQLKPKKFEFQPAPTDLTPDWPFMYMSRTGTPQIFTTRLTKCGSSSLMKFQRCGKPAKAWRAPKRWRRLTLQTDLAKWRKNLYGQSSIRGYKIWSSKYTQNNTSRVTQFFRELRAFGTGCFV